MHHNVHGESGGEKNATFPNSPPPLIIIIIIIIAVVVAVIVIVSDTHNRGGVVVMIRLDRIVLHHLLHARTFLSPRPTERETGMEITSPRER